MSYRYPRNNPPARVTNPRQTTNTSQNTDVDALQQCFPSFDREAITTIYTSLNNNFEETYKALNVMGGAEQQHIAITPKRKVQFMCTIFDQLPAEYVRNTLKLREWSVEGALDDLLSAEERRSQREEEQRRREEEARRQRELEEYRVLQQRREEIERRNAYINLSGMFPRLNQDYILYQLQQNGWNVQAVHPILVYMEDERRRQEEHARQLREKQRIEEEARLKAQEEQRWQQNINQAVNNNWDALKNCTDWNQIMNFVNTPADEAAKKKEQEEKEYEFLVNNAAESFPHLTVDEIKQIFLESNWVTETAIHQMEHKGFDKVKQRLIDMFPALPTQQVEEILRVHFPDDAAAIRELGPLSAALQKEEVQMNALSKATVALDEALQRQKDFEQRTAHLQEQRKHRQAEIDSMPPGKEKDFMITVEEMKKQKDDLFISEGMVRHNKEINERKKRVEEEKQKLQVEEQAKTQVASPKIRTQNNKMKAFEANMLRKQEEFRKEQEEQRIARESQIANNLLASLGTEKFAMLQKAIHRAPGGVAKGFTRRDYKNLEKEKSELNEHERVTAENERLSMKIERDQLSQKLAQMRVKEPQVFSSSSSSSPSPSSIATATTTTDKPLPPPRGSSLFEFDNSNNNPSQSTPTTQQPPSYNQLPPPLQSTSNQLLFDPFASPTTNTSSSTTTTTPPTSNNSTAYTNMTGGYPAMGGPYPQEGRGGPSYPSYPITYGQPTNTTSPPPSSSSSSSSGYTFPSSQGQQYPSYPPQYNQTGQQYNYYPNNVTSTSYPSQMGTGNNNNNIPPQQSQYYGNTTSTSQTGGGGYPFFRQ